MIQLILKNRRIYECEHQREGEVTNKSECDGKANNESNGEANHECKSDGTQWYILNLEIAKYGKYLLPDNYIITSFVPKI